MNCTSMGTFADFFLESVLEKDLLEDIWHMKQGLNLIFFEYMIWLEDEKGTNKKVLNRNRSLWEFLHWSTDENKHVENVSPFSNDFLYLQKLYWSERRVM